MEKNARKLFESLCRYIRETGILESIGGLLAWDEQTKMPAAGAEHRAEQYTVLSGILHRRLTAPTLGDLLGDLEDFCRFERPHSDLGATYRMVKRMHDRAMQLPEKLVEELSRTSVLSRTAWMEARQEDDFAKFRPWLEKTLGLKREQADAVGYDIEPYDALLDEYEPGMKTETLARVLQELGRQLVPLIEQAHGAERPPSTEVLRRHFPTAAQEAFAREMARYIGFDFDRGRLDVTTHPFCCSTGPDDVRITTRYNERFFNEAFFGVLHEAGHGIYEQGLPSEHFGLPLGEAVSLGVHESQSRLWENLVGRSKAFWRFALPRAKEIFPEALGDVSLEAFHRAINRIEPSPIRVEADEATYNLHVLIRFEMETALLDGSIRVVDAPEAWNDKYEEYLGFRPENDRLGILQDVHWSQGSIGYFPTYTLGNLYAAQLFDRAREELGDLDSMFERGHFEPLRMWLQEHVYQKGQRYLGNELIEEVTGKPLSSDAMLVHLRRKIESVYA